MEFFQQMSFDSESSESSYAKAAEDKALLRHATEDKTLLRHATEDKTLLRHATEDKGGI